jgi:hypothetical protein
MYICRCLLFFFFCICIYVSTICSQIDILFICLSLSRIHVFVNSFVHLPFDAYNIYRYIYIYIYNIYIYKYINIIYICTQTQCHSDNI